MAKNGSGETRLEDVLPEFLDEKTDNYAANLDRVVGKWIGWCAKRDVETLQDVSVRTMAAYADHLAQRVRAHQADSEQGITAGIDVLPTGFGLSLVGDQVGVHRRQPGRQGPCEGSPPATAREW